MDAPILILLLFLASFAGGIVPVLWGRSHRLLHIFLSLAAGFFLGVVFLHLLPELSHQSPDGLGLWPWVLAGLLLLLVFDLVLFGPRDHAVVGWATLLGLSIHALAAGLGLGFHIGASYAPLLAWALLSHKSGEAFSLMSAMRLSLSSRPRLMLVLVCFSFITPLGMYAGEALRIGSGADLGPILSAVAVGSFLYVAVGELLPEVFHTTQDRSVRLFALLAGVGFAYITAADVHEPGGGTLVQDLEGTTPIAQFFSDWLREGLSFFVEAAPFLLVGFFVAAIMRVLLPERLLQGLLGRDDKRAVLNASLLGVPLPLCSCSVLPMALGLRRQGASKGATVSFLVSTPETGVDSIAMTYALLDPFMTVIRPVAAFVSALVAGIATVMFGTQKQEPGDPALPLETVTKAQEGQKAQEAQTVPADATCCANDVVVGETERSTPFLARFRASLRYCFVDLLDDIVPSLLLGFLVSALVTVLMPNDFLEGGLGDGFSGLFIALVLSIPIYICASSSTPIAAALIAKGLSPGAGLVFLLVGPATNIGSLLVVGKELGRRVLFIYLSSVALVALLFGIIVNGFYSWRGEGPQTIVSDVVHGPGGSLQLVSALLLGLFCLGSLSRHVFLRSLVAKLLPGSSARKEAAER